MQGKLEDKEIFCFQLNIPVSWGNLEDKSVCMDNEENTWLNVPVETKETEATMCLFDYKYNAVRLLKSTMYKRPIYMRNVCWTEAYARLYKMYKDYKWTK
jgi:hypothetical protein